MGLNKYGKGDWRSISRYYVTSKTPTQVASHAQKFFRRQNSTTPLDRRRPSIHDIQTVKTPTFISMSHNLNNNNFSFNRDELLPFPQPNYGLINNPMFNNTYYNNNGFGEVGKTSHDQSSMMAQMNPTFPKMNNTMMNYQDQGFEANPCSNGFGDLRGFSSDRNSMISTMNSAFPVVYNSVINQNQANFEENPMASYGFEDLGDFSNYESSMISAMNNPAIIHQTENQASDAYPFPPYMIPYNGNQKWG